MSLRIHWSNVRNGTQPFESTMIAFGRVAFGGLHNERAMGLLSQICFHAMPGRAKRASSHTRSLRTGLGGNWAFYSRRKSRHGASGFDTFIRLAVSGYSAMSGGASLSAKPHPSTWRRFPTRCNSNRSATPSRSCCDPNCARMQLRGDRLARPAG